MRARASGEARGAVALTDPTLGVYVHVPFCQRICPYCDFAVVSAPTPQRDRDDRYVDALLRELAWRRQAFAGRSLSSLYLGGGTPSLLSPDAVARIVDGVRAAFPAPPGSDGTDLEVTLEVNPSTVERGRLPGFRSAGVNRVSVGVQSFHDTVLRHLGRAHRAEEGRHTLRACREASFDAISIDLIFAAPYQSLKDFADDVAEVIAFAPQHVSTYELTVEPATPFALAASRGQLGLHEIERREELAVAMVETAESALGRAGFDRYEISNYARPGYEAIHNQRYWQRLPVLGLGLGAVSNDPPGPETPFGVRRSNRRDLAGYQEAVAAARSPEASAPEVLDAPTARGEAVFLALRALRGLDAARFAREFGGPPRQFYAPAIEELVCQGLLEEGGGGAPGDLRLTARGRRFSDGVFEHFV